MVKSNYTLLACAEVGAEACAHAPTSLSRLVFILSFRIMDDVRQMCSRHTFNQIHLHTTPSNIYE